MVIDIHAHIADYKLTPKYFLQESLADFREKYVQQTGSQINDEFIKTIALSTLKDPDCLKLKKSMDDAGVVKTVLLVADFGYGHDCDLTIEDLYRNCYNICENNPSGFIPFCGIDPRRGKEGLDLFEKYIRDFRFKGLKLYPPCGFELNDRIVFPFYEICESYGIPVLAHIGPSLRSMKSEFDFPSSILEVSGIFKNVNFILGHAAILYFDECRDLPEKRDNIYLEVSGFQKQIEDSSGIESKMAYLLNKYPDKILFGTDWPMFNFLGKHEKWAGFFREMKLIDEGKLELFFYKNARQVLALQEI